MKSIFYIDWNTLFEGCDKLAIAFFYTEHEFRAGFNDFSLVSPNRFLDALKNTVALADAKEQSLLQQQYEQVKKRLQDILSSTKTTVYVNIEGNISEFRP